MVTTRVAKQVGSWIIIHNIDSAGNRYYTLQSVGSGRIHSHSFRRMSNAEKRAKALNQRMQSNTGRA